MDSISPSVEQTPPGLNSTPAPDGLVALAGTPNAGKTTLFNALTGLRQKVANFPGVTVERVTGRMAIPGGADATVVDLPGCYSLRARSDDERVARNVLLGLDETLGLPGAVVAVIDAAHPSKGLFLLSQLAETGLPLVAVLNQADIAERTGFPADPSKLEAALGIPVVAAVARTGRGCRDVAAAVLRARPMPRPFELPAALEAEVRSVAGALREAGLVRTAAVPGEALRMLTQARDDDPFLRRAGPGVRDLVAGGRKRLAAAGVDYATVDTELRYAWAADVERRTTGRVAATERRASERIDNLLTHPVAGPAIFLAVMAVIFQSIYTWATPFMDAIEAGMDGLAGLAEGALPPGTLTDLLTQGILAGVGNVLVFLPQIALLFLFLTILEDIGYLARAAFLIDGFMRKAGLQGRSFVPLMSSFACAIPGIMAARTIENRRDRMVTILIAPFMSCSARLPIYALMIGAFVPAPWQGATLFSMYFLSIAAGLGAAYILRKTIFRGGESSFLMELPDYRAPSLRNVLRAVYGRSAVFVKNAGSVILAISIVLWAILYFPRSPELDRQAEARVEAGEDEAGVERWRSSAAMEQSFGGRIGRFIEPAIEPLGFDWKIGIGLVASFAAREVMVASLAITYAVDEADEEDESRPGLRQKLAEARRPDGTPVFTLATALSLMVFFVLASQCMSTLAIIRRELNSWKWPLFAFAFMTTLAYTGAWIVYQTAIRLGGGP